MKKGLLWCILALLAVPMAQAQDISLDFPAPVQGAFDPASVSDIDVLALPVLPEVTETAQAIYARGQENGVQAQRFSKFGDCMTASESFLHGFGTGDYDLGEYTDLQAVVDYFAIPARDEDFTLTSWDNPGLGTQSGFNTFSAIDPLWADPKWCSGSEGPVTCELRNSRPAFALVMFGTNDVTIFEAADFDFYLRTIVLELIAADSVPVLYTFPRRPEQPEKTVLFNQIVAQIAADYDLPLVNLHAAIEDLPFHGVDEAEPIHLSLPADARTTDLTASALESGYNVRNLLTLQALELLVRGLAGEEALAAS